MQTPAVPQEFVVIDVETTGFKPEEGHEIVELAAQKIRGNDVTARFHSLLLPERPVGIEATKVHGITMEMLVAEGKPAAMVMPEFLAFIGNAVLIGHNVPFDIGFINAHLKKLGTPPLTNRTLDTLDLARRFLIIPSYALESVAQYLKVPAPITHRAMADVDTTRQVFLKLVERASKVGR